jgi:hypothetical protein
MENNTNNDNDVALSREEIRRFTKKKNFSIIESDGELERINKLRRIERDKSFEKAVLKKAAFEKESLESKEKEKLSKDTIEDDSINEEKNKVLKNLVSDSNLNDQEKSELIDYIKSIGSKNN